MKMLKLFLIVFILFVPCKMFSQVVGETACKSNVDGLIYRDPASGLVNGVLGLVLGPGYGSQVSGTFNQYGPCVSYKQYYYKPVGGACRICATGFVLNVVLLCNGVISTGTPGTLVEYDIIDCNLDDYSWTLGAAAGLFGVFLIRRRNKL